MKHSLTKKSSQKKNMPKAIFLILIKSIESFTKIFNYKPSNFSYIITTYKIGVFVVFSPLSIT